MAKPQARSLTIAELETINNATGHGALSVSDALSKLAILATDADAKERRAAHRCKACEYLRRGRLAGQAFTLWKCQLCANPQPLHPNTAVPRLCVECAKAYGLCVECGGDVELRHRGRRTGRKASK